MIRAKQVPARLGWAWVTRGIALLRKEPMLWMAMAFLYLAFAMLLELIPFIGWLILALFTPILMLGALSVSAEVDRPGLPAGAVPAPPTERNFGTGAAWRAWTGYLRNLLLRATHRLIQGFSEEEKLLPIMVVSTLLLGGLVVIRILAALLKVDKLGASGLITMVGSGVSPSVWLMTLLGLAIVLTLEVLLIMAFLYTVPLILYRREHPLPAIESSFGATLNNLGAFALFGGAFTLTVEVMRALFHFFFFPFDYLAFLAIGLVALPVFIAGLYASYQDLYPPRNA
jgi:uncharacterized membrane protein